MARYALRRPHDAAAWRTPSAAIVLGLGLAVACFYLYERSHVPLAHQQQLLPGGAGLAAAGGGSGGVEGILCTTVLGEEQWLPEWIQFHLLVGATKIVIYTDDQADSSGAALAARLSAFGGAVIVHNVHALAAAEGLTLMWGPGLTAIAVRHKYAYRHCSTTYGGKHKRGWLGVWDVDEFMFPCVRPYRGSSGGGGAAAVGAGGAQPGVAAAGGAAAGPSGRSSGVPAGALSSSLFEEFSRVTGDNVVAHQVRCLIFGATEHDQPLTPGQLVTQQLTRRAPEPLALEAGMEPWVRQNLSACTEKPDTCQSHSRKSIYWLHKLPLPGYPLTHIGLHEPENAPFEDSWDRPFGGLCCNHYQFRSTQDMQAKNRKNSNKHYNNVARSPEAKAWYRTVLDTQVWQYLPDLIEGLQARGLAVNTSWARE